MHVNVFADFDGTITREDVGNAVFHGLGGDGCLESIAAYRAGELSARDYFRREALRVGEFRREDLNGIIDSATIDPSFVHFVEFCTANGMGLTILSDGLNYYINRILERHGLEAAWVSNLMSFGPGSRAETSTMELRFPFSNPDCDRCACCKRNIMLSASGEDDYIVFVGEGYSDFCPAGYADLVFAKDSLQTYCQRENISYLPYSTFSDVRRQMEDRILNHTLRRRHRAELARRAAFTAE
jgi:2,3-diketo-5-methylthio-1-phosphopentane phosphatase